MQELTFHKFQNELDDLLALMTENRWDYHGNVCPSREQVSRKFHDGWYEKGKETFWIHHREDKIGLLILLDINDPIPLFDIRLAEKFRGKGIGKKAVQWLTQYVFNLPDHKMRLEAHTRVDNLAMRKTLYKSGFVKEGYFRCSWNNEDGSISDSICFSMIREDWENETRTPIPKDDCPY